MNADQATTIFRSVKYVFENNLDGITQEESVANPIENCNNINWIAGHIVATRIKLFDHLAEPLGDPGWKARYLRGNAPTSPDEIVSLEDIVAEFQRTDGLLMEIFNSRDWTDEANLALLPKCVWFAFHESYHSGQLGLLRKALGKKGIIR